MEPQSSFDTPMCETSTHIAPPRVEVEKLRDIFDSKKIRATGLVWTVALEGGCVILAVSNEVTDTERAMKEPPPPIGARVYICVADHFPRHFFFVTRKQMYNTINDFLAQCPHTGAISGGTESLGGTFPFEPPETPEKRGVSELLSSFIYLHLSEASRPVPAASSNISDSPVRETNATVRGDSSYSSIRPIARCREDITFVQMVGHRIHRKGVERSSQSSSVGSWSRGPWRMVNTNAMHYHVYKAEGFVPSAFPVTRRLVRNIRSMYNITIKLPHENTRKSMCTQ